MSDLIPTVNWTDFLKVAKLGKLRELKSCEIFFNSEYLFTFISPQNDHIRIKAEYDSMVSNSIGGISIEDILKV